MSIIDLEALRNSRYVGDNAKVGTSDCSKYIPIIGLCNHTLLTFEEGQKVVEFKLPKLVCGTSTRNYQTAIMFIINSTSLKTLSMTLAGETHKVIVGLGSIFDTEGNILMSLNIDSEYIISEDINTIINNPDKSKFKILVSTEFVTLPQYKNFRRKLKTEYFDKALEEGIDIITSSNPEVWNYQNNYETPRFSTPGELREHLRTVPEILLID